VAAEDAMMSGLAAGVRSLEADGDHLAY